MKEKVMLPENSVLYVAPSTTGENTIPAVMARKLKEDNPSAEIVENYAEATHLVKSANKSAFEKINDPVRWELTADLKATGRPSYLVEDVITTGESIRALREELARKGIAIHGAVSLQQGDQKEMYEADFKRMFAKLEANKELQADIRKVMGGQLRRRAGVIESAITYGTETQKNDVRTYFTREAERVRKLDPGTRTILREFGSPSHALQHGKSRQTGHRQGH